MEEGFCSPPVLMLNGFVTREMRCIQLSRSRAQTLPRPMESTDIGQRSLERCRCDGHTGVQEAELPLRCPPPLVIIPPLQRGA